MLALNHANALVDNNMHGFVGALQAVCKPYLEESVVYQVPARTGHVTSAPDHALGLNVPLAACGGCLDEVHWLRGQTGSASRQYGGEDCGACVVINETHRNFPGRQASVAADALTAARAVCPVASPQHATAAGAAAGAARLADASESFLSAACARPGARRAPTTSAQRAAVAVTLQDRPAMPDAWLLGATGSAGALLVH